MPKSATFTLGVITGFLCGAGFGAVIGFCLLAGSLK